MNERVAPLLLSFLCCACAIACETKSVPQQASQTPSSSSAAAAAATASPPSSAAAPASDGRAEILQKTLEIDSLNTYWHDTSSPLQIASSDVVGLATTDPASRPALTMFGKPVVYIAAPTPAMIKKRGACTETKDPSVCAFRFTSLSMSGATGASGVGSTAAVDFVLPREGVSGHVDFERDPKGSWIVKKKSVAEH